MRPEAHAGPTDLKLIPLKSDEDTEGLTWVSVPFVSFLLSLLCAHRLHVPAIARRRIRVRIFFIYRCLDELFMKTKLR
jgi:hypothetical protein